METKEDILIRRSRALCNRITKWVETQKSRGSGRDPLDGLYGEYHALVKLLNELEREHPEARPGYVRKVEETGRGGEKTTKEYHESFGVISMTRSQALGRGDYMRLFGSSLDMHPVTFTLRIQRAVRHRRDGDNANYWVARGEDQPFEETNIAEVNLSMHQFAELISHMNVSEGVPCTIRYANGIQMEYVPEEVRHEHEEILDDLAAQMKTGEGAPRAQLAMDKIKEILEDPKTIGKKKREELLKYAEMLKVATTQDLPHHLERVNEGLEKVRAHMKADIDGMMSHIVEKLGIKALQGGADPRKALTEDAES